MIKYSDEIHCTAVLYKTLQGDKKGHTPSGLFMLLPLCVHVLILFISHECTQRFKLFTYQLSFQLLNADEAKVDEVVEIWPKLVKHLLK